MEQIQIERPWHSLSIREVFKTLSATPSGLSRDEVNLRQQRHGENVFKYKERYRFLKLLIRQIKSPLVFILIIAGFLTLFLRVYTDAIIIFIAVSINTAIGVFQEGKASQSFARLRDSQKKSCTVVRENKKQLVNAEEVVPGDILVVQAGEQIGADARLIEQKGLEINEAVLTGEWLACSKDTKKMKETTPLTERSNMLWMGTLATEGWGKAMIVNTGFHTEVGKIAELIKEEEKPPTPFQKSIKRLSKLLGLLVLAALVFIFAGGLLRGQPVSEMFFMSVAIAVAAIPSGLPVVVSVVLAIGMGRILSKGGLIKKLPAVETLGSVDIALVDKTGTLTQAIMRVSEIITLSSNDSNQVLKMAIWASDAFVENPDDEISEWLVRGRHLEQALILAGVESGVFQHELLKEQPRLDFLPFESERRFAASLNKIKDDSSNLYVSGAPEFILDLSEKIYKNGRAANLTDVDRQSLNEALEKQASLGARVIAAAYKTCKLKEFPRDHDDVFEDFVFGGFIVFHDPIRPDVPRAIEAAERAGIRIVMVTGDHQKTAKKIAEETGIFKQGEKIITGEELEDLTDERLKKVVEKTSVFARVVPHQKLRIVKAWQAQDRVVAMTGDGINDAPALRRAEIGVALGSGTEVAKESSELVLLNNSFTVIISAIEEGRKILMNLRKVLIYLLSTGFSEIILIGSALAAGLPLPILPAQILWANLVEEGFMNFAFAFEPKEKDIMKKRPRFYTAEYLLTAKSKKIIFTMSFITAFILIILFLALYFIFRYPIEHIRTIVFAALSIDSIFFAFSLKNLKKPIWKINIFSNRYLIFAVLISLGFLAAALFVPAFRYLLSLEVLRGFEILMIIGVGLLNLFAIEIVKHHFIQKRT